MVGYLDPTSAAVGYVGMVAVNQALGGTFENFDPAIGFFKELQKNQPIVPKQTSYARVLSGEIPILFDYDFNAYRGKYTDKAPIEFVIPTEGTVVVPYVMALVKSGPNADNGKKVLDFTLSDEGQRRGRTPTCGRSAGSDDSGFVTKFLRRRVRARQGDRPQAGDRQKAVRDRYQKEVG